MRFKISIYETKKYKTSKNKILEFSEFKDIVDVDKKHIPLLYYFRKRLNFNDEKHDILKLKRSHIKELIEVLENRKLFKYYGEKKLWFGIFGEGFIDKKLDNGKYLVNLVEFTEDEIADLLVQEKLRTDLISAIISHNEDKEYYFRIEYWFKGPEALFILNKKRKLKPS